ncbi:histidine phosphatase family protein [Sphingobium sp. ba1]|uniref:histidine phosphatase family protein n=1 Tax=Sphingobium sp. ba1 TaxID=1522072 RepID=UPI000568BDA1|nr:histidine phosphatase family protein [Sphingobium sp. ba1]
MQLILVRHGLPENAHTRDASNPPLSEAGRVQAAQTCERLAREPIDAIYASTLHRAVQSGEPLAAALGLPISQLADIGEVDNGEDLYISPEAIKAAGEWDEFLRDPIRYYGHDEAEFRARVLGGFETIFNAVAGRRVAIFTHGFPINILLAHALGLTGIANFVPRNGSITRLMGDRLGNLQVLSINETSHFSKEVVR